jgi:hypothetical protein
MVQKWNLSLVPCPNFVLHLTGPDCSQQMDITWLLKASSAVASTRGRYTYISTPSSESRAVQIESTR